MNKFMLLFLCLFFLSQKVVSEETTNITIAFEERPLRSVLYKLEEKSEFQFIFQDEVPDTLTVASHIFENESLSPVLGTLLANTGYSYVILTFTHRQQKVIIFKLSEAVQNQEPTPITVTGRVLHRNGGPILIAWVAKRKEDGTISQESTVGVSQGDFEITVDNPNTYLVAIGDNWHLPRVVHIKDAELIRLEANPSPPVMMTGPGPPMERRISE